MKKNEFNKNLINFINKSTCSFTCIEEIKKILNKNGYHELKEEDKWLFKYNKYYIIRNDSSIIAFNIKSINKSFNIITTHSDTPSLLLKPNGENISNNYLKYNVMPYGGILNYGWLDHPLSIAGRIITKNNNILHKKIIDFKKEMMIIPSVAIHQKTDSNSNLDLNSQIDLQPIVTLSKKSSDWEKILKSYIKDKIIDYDLFLYNNKSPIILDNELLVSPRIDNLTSVYSGLQSLIDSDNKNIKVFCAFNSEEIGNLTSDGADSNFLLNTLKKICASINIDYTKSLSNSFIISSDNTHGIHPNHPEYADTTGMNLLGNGFSIIKEIESTTNSISSSIIKTICDKNKIKYQISTSKNDITSGSSLSNINIRQVSILSIDVGIPEISMHSSIETCSISDIYELYKMMRIFYNTKIIIKKESININ